MRNRKDPSTARANGLTQNRGPATPRTKKTRSDARDLSGKKFGRLTVLKEGEPHWSKSGKSYYRAWVCRCDCGIEKSVIQNGLTSKRKDRTQSCGCLQRESVSERQMYVWLTDSDRAVRRIFQHYASCSKRQNREFSISLDFFAQAIKSPCKYCGAKPGNLMVFKSASFYKQRTKVEEYNGLDRVDNSKGYTLDNVVPCCAACNRAKRSMSVSEFSTWIHRLHQHMYKTWWNIEPIVSAA